MCGLLGIVAPYGQEPGVDDATVVAMRDTMRARGPDGAGLWRAGNVVLAHRRLAVIDLSEAGAQPMVSSDGRYALVYNGELYNDAQMRRELASAGVRFATRCDTETVLHALRVWGEDALQRMRGMFALAFCDTRERTLLLARDALGVKPLHYARTGGRLVFGSEARAILAHPAVTPEPDLPMISAYLTTIRTTLGDRTLFAGVHALEPGTILHCDASGDDLRLAKRRWWLPAASIAEFDGESVAGATRDVVESAIADHLHADVPVCALLSGGLDSAITSTIASEHLPALRTYAAGRPAEASEDDGDIEWAQRVADTLGTRHAEAILDEDLFAERWAWMVRSLGTPLSTPNEVAIYEVARLLREDGCIVTMSGEGADELFAGYGPPMQASWDHEAASGVDGGRFLLEAASWTPVDLKPALLRIDAWEGAERDGWLVSEYRRMFDECAHEAGASAHGVEAHLRMYRSINLTGLLGRLDTSTMLASVEGRTPFADREVADFAGALPMSCKYEPAQPAREGDGGVAIATEARTKIALREAFRDRLTPGVADRPKASFPLPFDRWMHAHATAPMQSSLLQSLVREEALHGVAQDPAANWRVAWPLINLALWARRWWD